MDAPRPPGHVILRAVAQLAAGLGLTAVAEGIERIEQLQLVQRIGCDRVQGFLFSPADPAGLVPTLPTHASD